MSSQGDKIGKNAGMIEQAVLVLKQLADRAGRNSMSGTIAVEVSFKDGFAAKIRRQVNDTVGRRGGD